MALEESGGTRAVAMATPTNATLSRGEIIEYAPAAPPPNAIIGSIRLGAVRA
jgi:hypothetical protein